MAQRVLEINVAYAEGLKDVNLFTKMDVYVVVSVVGDNSNVKQKTNVHRDSGTHPTWNFPMRFTIDESCALQGRLNLIFRLKCEGSLTDADIGEVCVPIKDLLDSSSPTSEGKSSKFVHYQVTKPSGRGQGMLTFSYKFGETINGTRAVEPVKCAAEPTQPITYPPPPQHQQPMGPGFGYCGLSSQETHQPNLYPQPPGPYPHSYPALPEQPGYIYSQPPVPYPHLYPPPPVPANGSLYSHPPPASPGPNYAYMPHQQQQPEQVYPPTSPAAYIYPPQQQSPYPYPPQQQSPYPYPPQPEHQYPYTPQVYPGYGYPPHLQQPK